MKAIISAIVMIACFCFSGAKAQNAVIYMNQILEPIPGKVVEFEAGVKAHNAKYHASGEDKANLFSIMTGPRSGMYAWVQGPMSLAQMDKVLSKEHIADWEKNVGAFSKRNGEIRFVRRDAELSYNPDSKEVVENYIVRIFYGVTDLGALRDGMGMVKKIYETNKIPTSRTVFTTEFRNQEGEDIALVYPFKSWTEFEKRKGLAIDNLSAEMNKGHGANGWKVFEDKMEAGGPGWYDEVRIMVK
jgi:hypothetical protein